MYARLLAQNHLMYAEIQVCLLQDPDNVPACDALENPHSYYKKKFHGNTIALVTTLLNHTYVLLKIPYHLRTITSRDRVILTIVTPAQHGSSITPMPRLILMALQNARAQPFQTDAGGSCHAYLF